MSKKSDGGPAFPLHAPSDDHDQNRCLTTAGMTVRQWYAGQALAGLAANPAFLATMCTILEKERPIARARKMMAETLADTAAIVAAAMIAEDAA